ncbi:MAG: cobalamin-binding protein [Candidatus Rokubacteria bacterium]|nr:cobalamin-binding protein [Candidatus Rokubacteria bacterium]
MTPLVGFLTAALLLATPLAGAALTLTDLTGRTVTLPAMPQRIISLVPGATEILFAIGAQDRLVGVTDFCDYPPEARRKPSVGGMLAPSLETMVALRPDLVVATPSGNREETVAQLERLRIPVYLVNPASVADVLRMMEGLGAVTGRRETARQTAQGLRLRIKAVAERVAARPRPRVLYVLWPDPLIVPARGAVVTELIALAGGESVTAGAGEGYPRYSLEAAVAQAPEVILLARHSVAVGPVSLEKWDRLTSLAAIRSGRLHAVDGDLFHRQGARIAEALEALARLIHPGAFPRAATR